MKIFDCDRFRFNKIVIKNQWKKVKFGRSNFYSKIEINDLKNKLDDQLNFSKNWLEGFIKIMVIKQQSDEILENFKNRV